MLMLNDFPPTLIKIFLITAMQLSANNFHSIYADECYQMQLSELFIEYMLTSALPPIHPSIVMEIYFNNTYAAECYQMQLNNFHKICADECYRMQLNDITHTHPSLLIKYVLSSAGECR